MKPATALEVARSRNQDDAIGPTRDGFQGIVCAVRVGQAITFRDHVALSAGSQIIECAPEADLVEREFQEPGRQQPCPKRLLSQIKTAFLATRSISFTTAVGFAA